MSSIGNDTPIRDAGYAGGQVAQTASSNTKAGGYTPPPEVEKAVKHWDDSFKAHQHWVRDYERRERAYRGLLHYSQPAARWRHTMHPPHIFPLIETIVANTVDMGLDLNCTPSPVPGLTMQDAQARLLQADTVRNLIKHEWRYDDMHMKQRALFLCDAIGGRSIGKSSWNWQTGTVKKQGITNVEVHDEHTGELLGVVPQVTEIQQDGVLFDNSTFEVIDPRDFVFHESAKAMQPREPGGAQYVFHRGWYSMEQLRYMQSIGFVSNVDRLSETRHFIDEYGMRERELWNVRRAKDLVEVLEYWCYEQGKVWRSIIGNRHVLLREREENPFWHQKYPFIVCSSSPTPFGTIGMSDVELVEQIQEMLWELTNQRLDNLELINNAIMLIRSDVDDPDAFQFYPGAMWQVDDPKQVEPLVPPYQVANVSLEAETLLMQNMQSVTSAAPMTGGLDNGGGKTSQTATGASLIMTAAQQRLAVKKFHAHHALAQEATMRLQNCQQFITDTRLVHTVGPSGKMMFKQLSPLDIQGDFMFSLRAINEAQNRQERRAEAQSILQLMMQAFPMSYVSGTPIDLHEVLLWTLRAWDMEDEAEAFFEPPQQPDPALAQLLMGNSPKVQLRGMLDPGQTQAGASHVGIGDPNNPQGGPAETELLKGGQNMGTTASTAVDASKPSATGGQSLSGAQFLQRAKALSGSPGGRV